MSKHHQFVEDTPHRTSACQAGCTLQSRHVDECAPEAREACWGCLPARAAANSTLCERCGEHAAANVGKIPGLVTWIRDQTEPGRGGEGPRVAASKTPPVPVRVDAVDGADALHAAVAGWCQTVTAARGLPGPDLTGSTHPRWWLEDPDEATPVIGLAGLGARMAFASGRTHVWAEPCFPAPGCEGPRAVRRSRYVDRLTDKGGWQDDNPSGIPVAVTVIATAWLLTHLPWILGQAWAAEMVEDIGQTVRQAEARWSPSPRPERANADCFDCDRPLYRKAGDEGFSDFYECSGCRKTYAYPNYLQALKARLQREKERELAEAAALVEQEREAG